MKHYQTLRGFSRGQHRSQVWLDGRAGCCRPAAAAYVLLMERGAAPKAPGLPRGTTSHSPTCWKPTACAGACRRGRGHCGAAAHRGTQRARRHIPAQCVQAFEVWISAGMGEDMRRSVRVGKLNLVDLAGSERVHITGATGAHAL